MNLQRIAVALELRAEREINEGRIEAAKGTMVEAYDLYLEFGYCSEGLVKLAERVMQPAGV